MGSGSELDVIFGHLRTKMEAKFDLEAVLRLSWGVLRRSWAVLGRSWGDLGGSWGAQDGKIRVGIFPPAEGGGGSQAERGPP